MLNFLQPSDRGLLDNRPCGYRGTIQYPRLLKCDDPHQALALIEDVVENIDQKDVAAEYQRAAEALAEELLVVIEALQKRNTSASPDSWLVVQAGRLSKIHRELDMLAVGEFL